MAAPAETTKVVPLTCHGHSRPVTHIHFSAVVDDDQYYLISACKDNNPMLRDGMTGDWIGTFIGHKGAVWQARLSQDATLAATGSADFTAKVWDTHTGETLHTLQHSHIVRSIAFPPQARPQILATGGAEKKLRIFDLSRSDSSPATGTSTPPAANGGTVVPSNGSTTAPSFEIGPGVHQGTIRNVVWTPDSNVLVTASEDQMLRWWDLRTRAPVGEYKLDGTVGSCEIDPSPLTESAQGSLSVAAGKSVYFFDAGRPATLIKQIKTDYEVASVALHGASRKFVTGTVGDTWVRVWDFDEGKEKEMGKGHHGPIWACTFSPDGKLYATGSEDGTVKLWKFTNGPYGLWR
ncbi:WD repeat protein [Microthyrium microscopicum]|uniref:Serine-threonine kinase receptor-associated protein n=1 Tax=Microthyrium microscopicum TaxID=703497 RepID=A0A6A6URA9_9PEZI|nr:WD repeat protein [Microthyrium microscopicum]